MEAIDATKRQKWGQSRINILLFSEQDSFKDHPDGSVI